MKPHTNKNVIPVLRNGIRSLQLTLSSVDSSSLIECFHLIPKIDCGVRFYFLKRENKNDSKYDGKKPVALGIFFLYQIQFTRNGHAKRFFLSIRRATLIENLVISVNSSPIIVNIKCRSDLIRFFTFVTSIPGIEPVLTR